MKLSTFVHTKFYLILMYTNEQVQSFYIYFSNWYSFLLLAGLFVLNGNKSNSVVAILQIY